AVPTMGSSRRRRKSLEVEAVIAEPDSVRARRKASEVATADFRAGHNPFCFGQLCAFLPGRNCPDVLGMRRRRPIELRDHRRIAGHRRGRMKEMRVKMADIRWQLRREDQSLAEAADAV